MNWHFLHFHIGMQKTSPDSKKRKIQWISASIAPLRITAGPKHLVNGSVEFKPRALTEIEIVQLDKVLDKVCNFYKEE